MGTELCGHGVNVVLGSERLGEVWNAQGQVHISQSSRGHRIRVGEVGEETLPEV